MAAAEYLTAGEVASLLNISTRTVSRWLKDGRIPSVKIGRSHRIPRASIQGIDSLDREWDATIEVPMNYPGNVISKNHMRTQTQRHSLKREAVDWRDSLADFVRMGFLAKGAKGIALPVVIEVHCRFVSVQEGIDPQNCVELVADAVQKATGVNDRDYQITSFRPSYNPDMPPEILIKVKARCMA